MTDDRGKKRSKRKLVLFAIWTALIVAAVLWLRCGNGWGIGGSGKGSGSGSGSGPGSGSATSATPKRCDVRVTASGLELDGKPVLRDVVVTRCKQGVDVVVTGDAREGDWGDLQRALDSANIPVFKK